MFFPDDNIDGLVKNPLRLQEQYLKPKLSVSPHLQITKDK